MHPTTDRNYEASYQLLLFCCPNVQDVPLEDVAQRYVASTRSYETGRYSSRNGTNPIAIQNRRSTHSFDVSTRLNHS